MTSQEFEFLISDAGKAMLEKYREEPDLKRLAFKLTQEHEFGRAVIELLFLRRKGLTKYDQAADMMFIREALEQSSSSALAEHVSKRFEGKNDIYDLTAGLGTMSHYFSKYGKVTSIELQETLSKVAEHNAQYFDTAHKATYINGDFADNLPEKADAIYLDPARREGEKRSRQLCHTAPNVLEWYPKLKAITPNIAIKVSPAFDFSDIYEFEDIPEIECIEWKGRLREAVLWFGDFKTCDYRATLLPENITVAKEMVPVTMAPTEYKYIYNPKAVWVHMAVVPQIAHKYNLGILSSDSLFLAGDEELHMPECKSYKVETILPFGELKQHLSRNKIRGVVFKQRGTRIDVDSLYKRFKVRHREDYYVFCASVGQKIMAIIAKKI
jgi:hypothetical protein